MLKTENVKFSYKNIGFIFPDVSCGAGQVLLITGKSGVGKTTLLHLLGGVLRSAQGKISIGDTLISGMRNRELDEFRGKHIGIVFQQAHYLAALSVLDNLLLCTGHLSRDRGKQRALELLDSFGMQDVAYQKPANISFGQQQRLSIARALINRPSLLLADEPTSSLDDDNCYQVAKVLEEQAKHHRSALVIVTHDHRLKKLFSNKIALS